MPPSQPRRGTEKERKTVSEEAGERQKKRKGQND